MCVCCAPDHVLLGDPFVALLITVVWLRMKCRIYELALLDELIFHRSWFVVMRWGFGRSLDTLHCHWHALSVS